MTENEESIELTRREVVEATSMIRWIPVLAPWYTGSCERCDEYTDTTYICRLPTGRHVMLCDQCIAQIWSRCLIPEEGREARANPEEDRLRTKIIAVMEDDRIILSMLNRIRDIVSEERRESIPSVST